MMESIVDRLIGERVQVYFDNTNKILKYSDFDTEQNIWVEGLVKWSDGAYFCLECDIVTPEKTFKKELIINSWSVLAAMKITDDHIRIKHALKDD